MFYGVHNGSVDDKGRLKLPAAVARRLRHQYGQTDLFVTSLEGREVLVYPLREWEGVVQRAAEPGAGPDQDARAKAAKRLKFWTNHYGGEANLDSQGRLMLPAELRTTSGIRGPVKVQWQSTHMLVLDEDGYQEERAKNALSASDLELAASLGM